MQSFDDALMRFLDDPWKVAGAAALVFALVLAVLYHGSVLFYLKFTAKSLFRNLLRTALTSAAIFVLVLVVTMVWTVLAFLDLVTAEKSKDLKAIVTEKWQIPSQMPFAYASRLSEGAPKEKGDYRVPDDDSMTWQFYGGTIDPEKRTRENIIFFFGMEPSKFLKMMDGLDELTDAQRAELERLAAEMERDKTKVVVGQERLDAMNKRVGDRIKVTSLNYRGIDLEMEIIGAFPPGRYDQSAVMNRDYLNGALDAYEKETGKKHPLAEKTLNLVWLRVPDTDTYNQVAGQIQGSAEFSSPAVKVQTASSGVASFLDAYKDLLWGMRWLLVPAVLITMAVVIANAIGISVRERRNEMAVLKVLGFGPGRIMMLVLGEALLIGCGTGLLSSAFALLLINEGFGGIKFPIAFFPAFRIPTDALWWGPVVGGVTALIGSIVPAWSARSVKVAEVFSKVT